MCFRTIFRHHDQPQSVKRRGQSGPQSLMKPVTALNESVTLSPPQTRQTSAAGPRQYVTQRTTHCHRRRRVIRHQRRDDVSNVITKCFYALFAGLRRNWRRVYTTPIHRSDSSVSTPTAQTPHWQLSFHTGSSVSTPAAHTNVLNLTRMPVQGID